MGKLESVLFQQGKPTTLRKIESLPPNQPPFHLFYNGIPDRHKTLRITITEGDKRMAKWASINDPKQAQNKETRANPQADKGKWVPKQNQPIMGLVDQLETQTRPSPVLEDKNGGESSSKPEFTSSTCPMALSDDDSETVDDLSGSEEDGLDTTEAGRELMVYPAVSDVLGVEDIMTEEEASHEDEGTVALLTPELDGFRGMSPL